MSDPKQPEPVTTPTVAAPLAGAVNGTHVPAESQLATKTEWKIPADTLRDLLAECVRTGKAEALYDAYGLCGMVSDGFWNDFRAELKSVKKRGLLDVNIAELDERRRRKQATAQRSNNFNQSFEEAKATGKPAIIVNSKQLSALRMEAIAALQQGNSPPVLFRRQRDLVRVGIDARNQPFVDALNWISMRSMLSDAASFYKSEGGAGIFPPRPLAEDLCACNHAEGTFPALDGIVGAPVVRPDGTVCVTPGYDQRSRMIYAPPPGFVLPAVPTSPTAEQIAVAKNVLQDVTADFQFETRADETNFFAFMLTPLIRQLVDVVPLAAVDSPTSGAGKSLLTDVVSVIATGEVCAVIPPPTTAEEWGKLLPALLDSGRTFICFDNLHDVLRSAALEATLTKPFLQFRQLGQTKERIVRNCAVWCATGNNLTVSRDAVRRCFRIRIDPRCAQPHLRKNFRHPNLVEYCKAERGNLLAAVLTLVCGWFAAGKPGFKATALGTFTAWKDVAGGILRHAGFADFLANQRSLYSEMDTETEEWERLLLSLEEIFKDKEFSVGQLVNMIHMGSIGNLPRELAKVYGSSTTHVKSKPNPYFGVQVGHLLRSKRGTCFGEAGICLERATEDRHAKVVLYKIGREKPRESTVTPVF